MRSFIFAGLLLCAIVPSIAQSQDFRRLPHLRWSKLAGVTYFDYVREESLLSGQDAFRFGGLLTDLQTGRSLTQRILVDSRLAWDGQTNMLTSGWARFYTNSYDLRKTFFLLPRENGIVIPGTYQVFFPSTTDGIRGFKLDNLHNPASVQSIPGNRPVRNYFCRDGRTIVSSTPDGFEIWDHATNSTLKTISLGFLPASFSVFEDENTIVLNNGGRVRVYDMVTGQEQIIPIYADSGTNSIVAAYVTPDRKKVVYVTSRGVAALYNTETRKSTAINGLGSVFAVTKIQNRNSLVFFGYRPVELDLATLNTREIVGGFTWNSDHTLQISSDGLTGALCRRGEMHVYGLNAGEYYGGWPTEADRQGASDLSEDGNVLAVLAPAKSIHLVSATPQPRAIFSFPPPANAYRVLLNSGGSRLAVLGSQGQIDLYDLNLRQRYATISATGGWAIPWSGNFGEDEFYAVSIDGRIQLVNWNTGLIRSHFIFPNSIYHLKENRDTSEMVTLAPNNLFEVHDRASGLLKRSRILTSFRNDSLRDFSVDGKFGVEVRFGTLTWHDFLTNEFVTYDYDDLHPMRGLVLDPSGREATISTDGGLLRVINPFLEVSTSLKATFLNMLPSKASRAAATVRLFSYESGALIEEMTVAVNGGRSQHQLQPNRPTYVQGVLACPGFLARRTNVARIENGDYNVSAYLLGGDADGDNEVTIFDYILLSQAYGSLEGDSFWNPDVDFDFDGGVTMFDYIELSKNFGKVGDV